MERTVSAPAVIPEIAPFVSPNGKYITSRQEWREDMKSSGAIPWEQGLDKDIARNKESQLEKAFEPIAAGVDEAVSAMVQSGKLET